MNSKADAYLDVMLILSKAGVWWNARDYVDPWFAFETGTTFVKSTGRPRYFNNPCVRSHGKYIDHAHFWVSKGARALIQRANEGNDEARNVGFKIDHAVPIAVLKPMIERQPDREGLRAMLLRNFSRGILTKSENDRLNERFKASMPEGWQDGDDPYARYGAVGIIGEQSD